MTDPFARYDQWLESGPVDALTEAEREAERICAVCGERQFHLAHVPKPTRFVVGDEHEFMPDNGPDPDEAYELARDLHAVEKID